MLWKAPGRALGLYHATGTLEVRAGSQGEFLEEGCSSWALKEGRKVGSSETPGLGLIHLNLSAQHSTWHRVAVSDSSQLIKRGTTSLASCKNLLRAGAASDWQASLESLQPKDPLCSYRF